MKFKHSFPDLTARRVIIYRLGSLGDTIVALPSYNLIAKAFPNAERILLTNLPINAKAPSPKAILEGTGYIHTFISYPSELRSLGKLFELSKKIRNLKADYFIYLTGKRPLTSIFRDYIFFWLSKVGKLIGFPFKAILRKDIFIKKTGQYEFETIRLLKCLNKIGVLSKSESSPKLLTSSNEKLNTILFLKKHNIIPNKFIACAFGTKMPAKDWGASNWKELLMLIKKTHHSYQLVLFGAKSEYETSKLITKEWPNRVINLCGKLSPRESGAIMSKANFFIGLDSGPMHLAAASGIPCIAIFSSRDKKGVWYPQGSLHKILYTENIECKHCMNETCPNGNMCINSIKPSYVYKLCQHITSY